MYANANHITHRNHSTLKKKRTKEGYATPKTPPKNLHMTTEKKPQKQTNKQQQQHTEIHTHTQENDQYFIKTNKRKGERERASQHRRKAGILKKKRKLLLFCKELVKNKTQPHTQIIKKKERRPRRGAYKNQDNPDRKAATVARAAQYIAACAAKLSSQSLSNRPSFFFYCFIRYFIVTDKQSLHTCTR